MPARMLLLEQASQKGNDFKKIIHQICIALCSNGNTKFRAQCGHRSAASLFTWFKKLSECVGKFLGAEAMSQKPSGDSADKLWMQLCRKTWAERNPEDVNLVDSVVACIDFPHDKPKWRVWQNNEEEEAKRVENNKKRPAGNEKAKQIEQDCEMVQSFDEC